MRIIIENVPSIVILKGNYAKNFLDINEIEALFAMPAKELKKIIFSINSIYNEYVMARKRFSEEIYDW
ncbi:hypothetical protein [Candidatus Kuenenia stuttgartiensis]|uniref:hypothetical protein n=1 Tax=Kuenenia stuttgartiensis TaxID=174633 RepID=UPI00146A46EA|nr:hypothetical protein [Candidatus Kuenenia stuttgartiensis]